MTYYYAENNEKRGPFSLEELRNKSLKEDTLIWYPGLEKWTYARNIEEIKSIIPSNDATHIQHEDISHANTEIVSLKREENKEGDKKTRHVKKTYISLIFFLLISMIGLSIWLKDDIMNKINKETVDEQNIKENQLKDPAVNTLITFFDNLNSENYLEAYGLTNHARWNSLSNFKNYLGLWKILDVNEINGKSYYSRYGADTILNVKYRGIVDESETILDLDFDYHLKKFNNASWKIVRIYEPRDPEYNILKNDEVPKNAKEAVTNFLNFLDKKLYIKAHKLSGNPDWGNEDEFNSQNKFGCISNVQVYNISEVESEYNDLEIIYARYYVDDPCNNSRMYNVYFYLSNKKDYWKIIASKNIN